MRVKKGLLWVFAIDFKVILVGTKSVGYGFFCCGFIGHWVQKQIVNKAQKQLKFKVH